MNLNKLSLKELLVLKVCPDIPTTLAQSRNVHMKSCYCYTWT